MNRLRDGIDCCLAWLKWPVAVLAVLLIPGSVIALLGLLRDVVLNPGPMLPFLFGIGTWLVLWWTYFRRSRFTPLLTLEHELTHVLFAWLTFHRVTSLRVTLMKGGRVSYVGTGNWLIAVAPYFWPTASLMAMALVWLLPGGITRMIGEAFIGATLAWNVTSTLRETHGEQTDLQKVGGIFSFMFLPAANLIAAGTILAFAHGGIEATGQFLLACFRVPWGALL